MLVYIERLVVTYPLVQLVDHVVVRPIVHPELNKATERDLLKAQFFTQAAHCPIPIRFADS
jgi:hypothetical protein